MLDRNYDIIDEDLDKNSKITIKSNTQMEQIGHNPDQSNSSKEDSTAQNPNIKNGKKIKQNKINEIIQYKIEYK
jgi:hypothetical protein